jgi:hypothetical protein
MTRKGFLQTLLLGCLAFAAGGCQWALTIQPGDMLVEPGKPVEITVAAERTLSMPGVNVIAVRGFEPPAPIRIQFTTGETWTRPAIRKIDAYHYVYTFRGTISASTEYVVDPGARIVRAQGRGAGPYKVTVETNTGLPAPSQEGLQYGREHMAGAVPTYRVVTILRDSQMSTADRDAFLKGFLSAYQDANNVAEGRKYTDVIREAVVGSTFDQARQDGIRHARNQINDSYVQSLISNTGGSGAAALAWKAGYIDGFADTLLAKNAAADREDAARQAEAMYSSLKRGMGL